MPRSAQVSRLDAINAICLFKHNFKNGELPAYTDTYYQNVSDKLGNTWSTHNVYIILRENRRELKTKVFEKLGIEKNVNCNYMGNISNLTDSNIELFNNSEMDLTEFNESEFTSGFVNNKNEEFNLFIKSEELWNRMKSVKLIFKNREYSVLLPGVWSDIVADEYWLQFRMPCAFSFKKAIVSSNPIKPFIFIQGKCNNEFHATAKTEPYEGADLWLNVKSRNTRDDPHEPIKRQLKNENRKVVGQQTLKEGVANRKRDIARKVLSLGNAPAPILCNSDVLRKLMQECIDEEFGVDSVDGGNNPVLIL